MSCSRFTCFNVSGFSTGNAQCRVIRAHIMTNFRDEANDNRRQATAVTARHRRNSTRLFTVRCSFDCSRSLMTVSVVPRWPDRPGRLLTVNLSAAPGRCGFWYSFMCHHSETPGDQDHDSSRPQTRLATFDPVRPVCSLAFVGHHNVHPMRHRRPYPRRRRRMSGIHGRRMNRPRPE